MRPFEKQRVDEAVLIVENPYPERGNNGRRERPGDKDQGAHRPAQAADGFRRKSRQQAEEEFQGNGHGCEQGCCFQRRGKTGIVCQPDEIVQPREPHFKTGIQTVVRKTQQQRSKYRIQKHQQHQQQRRRKP
jgi:hypothetical protein